MNLTIIILDYFFSLFCISYLFNINLLFCQHITQILPYRPLYLLMVVFFKKCFSDS